MSWSIFIKLQVIKILHDLKVWIYEYIISECNA
jgi:hypothetical protein